ncbi:MAG: ATP-binding cassette domain-containing protein [Myxococcota bacterium]
MREIKSHPSEIIIQNAHAHNLCIDEVRFPLEGIHVISGPSGSGKSTLVFDIIHREAQYRTLRALHSGVKPIEALPSPASADLGLLPPISAMKHDNHHKWPKSTNIGDVCHITPLLRGFYLKFASLYCPQNEEKLVFYTAATLAEKLMQEHREKRLHCLAPMKAKADYQSLIQELKMQGYARIAIDNHIVLIDDAPLNEPANWSLVIDRLKIQPKYIERLEMAIKSAYQASGHRFVALINGEPYRFYEKPFSIAEQQFIEPPNQYALTPQHQHSMCVQCHGHGTLDDAYCLACNGSGLGRISRLLRHNGHSYSDVLGMPLTQLRSILPESSHSRTISLLRQYIEPLISLGLGHLSIRHPANWLSSGERTRARLAALFNSAMPQSTLLIDEPSLGLDPDNHKLVCEYLLERSKEHPMIIIDHHPKLWEIATNRTELGPGAGVNGGRIVSPSTHPKLNVTFPSTQKTATLCVNDRTIKLSISNLNVICGDSGSGKSRLLRDILSKQNNEFEHVYNLNELHQVQNTRSCVATLTGAWGPIRTLLTHTAEAKIQGMNKSQFSFNTVGGRCESCKGLGIIRHSISGLPEFEQLCASCNGQRFEAHIRKVRYRNRNISEILEMDIQNALQFFSNHPELYPLLTALNEIGVGHLSLGQTSASLSGGETRRIHIAKTLSSAYRKGRTLLGRLYLLDEPTAALHPKDSEVLLRNIAQLCERGATFLCASHEPLLRAHAAQCIQL